MRKGIKLDTFINFEIEVEEGSQNEELELAIGADKEADLEILKKFSKEEIVEILNAIDESVEDYTNDLAEELGVKKWE